MYILGNKKQWDTCKGGKGMYIFWLAKSNLLEQSNKTHQANNVIHLLTTPY